MKRKLFRICHVVIQRCFLLKNRSIKIEMACLYMTTGHDEVLGIRFKIRAKRKVLTPTTRFYLRGPNLCGLCEIYSELAHFNCTDTCVLQLVKSENCERFTDTYNTPDFSYANLMLCKCCDSHILPTSCAYSILYQSGMLITPSKLHPLMV